MGHAVTISWVRLRSDAAPSSAALVVKGSSQDADTACAACAGVSLNPPTTVVKDRPGIVTTTKRISPDEASALKTRLIEIEIDNLLNYNQYAASNH